MKGLQGTESSPGVGASQETSVVPRPFFLVLRDHDVPLVRAIWGVLVHTHEEIDMPAKAFRSSLYKTGATELPTGEWRSRGRAHSDVL